MAAQPLSPPPDPTTPEAQPTRTTSYQVGLARTGVDDDEVVALWSRNAFSRPAERWRWLYGGDPENPGTLWTLRLPPGRLVGTAGLATRRMAIRSGTVLAGQAIDLVVDGPHRTLGPALQLERSLLANVAERGIGPIYAFPNERSEAVLRRIGYSRLGPLERWTRVLRSRSRVSTYVRPALLATVAGAVIDTALRVTSREILYSTPEGLSIECPAAVDSRFDDLWEAAARRFPVLGERSAAFLAWRFLRSPFATYEVLGVVRAKDRSLVGYAVLATAGTVIRIADLLYRDAAALDTLLGEVIRLARGRGASTLTFTFVGPGALAAALRRHGFARRPETSSVFVHGGAGPGGALPAAGEWYLTEADRDV